MAIAIDFGTIERRRILQSGIREILWPMKYIIGSEDGSDEGHDFTAIHCKPRQSAQSTPL